MSVALRPRDLSRRRPLAIGTSWQLRWRDFPTVQGAALAAVITVAGVVIAAFAGYGGAISGAGIAARAAQEAANVAQAVAEADRVEARQARLAERTLDLASTVLARSERHKHEVGLQFRSWVRAASEGINPDGVIPDVGPIDDVLDAVGGLYIVATQGTADAAWSLYTASRDHPDRLVYVATSHRQGDRVVMPSDDRFEAINEALLGFDAKKTAFLNAVRAELGRPALVDASPPFPEDDHVAGPAARISTPAYTTPPAQSR